MRTPDYDAMTAADDRLLELGGMDLVSPHYLKLMGSSAADADRDVLGNVAHRSRAVTDEQVRLMLAGGWRPLVMGCWYAIAIDDDALSDPVHDALETCQGNLTSPALITATLFYPSVRTLPLLVDYAATDRRMGWAAADIADAAVLRVTGRPPADGAAPAADAVARLEGLVDFGERLRAARGQRGWRAAVSRS